MNNLPFFDLCEFIAKKWHRKMGHLVSYEDIFSAAMFGYTKYYSKNSENMVKGDVWSKIEYQIIDDIRKLLGRNDKYGKKGEMAKSQSVHCSIDELFNVGQESNIEEIVDFKIKTEKELKGLKNFKCNNSEKTTMEYLMLLTMVEYSISGKVKHYISNGAKYNSPSWARKHISRKYPEYLDDVRASKREQVFKMYKDGISNDEIASYFNISAKMIDHYLRKSGIRRNDYKTAKEVIKLKNLGMKNGEIAEKVGIKKRSVEAFCYKYKHKLINKRKYEKRR